MKIAVVNQSTLVTPTQAAQMVSAISSQLGQFAQAWNRAVPEIDIYQQVEDVPAGAHNIALVDTIPNEPSGVLGYHTEDQKGQWGVVACKPELDAGAQVLQGDWSVSSVLSHEVLELVADPSCSFWGSAGSKAYALEVCDPVEAPTYTIGGISVSNFVLPSWFDPEGQGPFDFLSLLHHPFSLLKGGYVVYTSMGREHQKFGDEFPDWRRRMKEHPWARTHSRLEQAEELL